MPDWKGVIPAIVTPMSHDGNRVDHGALRDYCDFMVERGVQGIFCCGTTGEGPVLSISERREVAETIVSHVNKRIKVIVQTGYITTEGSVELTVHSHRIGADAAGVVFPYYYHLSDDILYRHFLDIAEAVPGFPIFIYNIPQYTGNNLSLELFEKLLAKVENVVGVKNSSADMLYMMELLQRAKGRCSVFVGNDGLILPALCAGANGIVSGNASAFPEPFLDIYRAFVNGDLKTALEKQLFIDKLRKVLASGRDVETFKKALEFRGFRAGGVRPPNRNLTEDEEETLKKSLKGLGLFS